MSYSIPRQISNIQLACQRLGYAFELVDKHSGYLCKVSNDNDFLYLGASFINAYPINSSTAYQIALDKAYTQMILEEHDIRTPKGGYFFITDRLSGLREAGKSMSEALTYAEELGYPLIAKPVNGSKGNYVQLVYDSEDLEKHLTHMSAQYHATLIQEKLSGFEYRAYVIDGTTRFVYKKASIHKHFPTVAAFREALLAENEARLKSGLNEYDLSSKYILALEDKISRGEPVNFQALNISSGHATIDEITTEIPLYIQQLSQQISKISNLRVLAYDFMSPQESIASIRDYAILEVNGNPMLDGLDLMGMEDLKVSIWMEVLQKAFQNR